MLAHHATFQQADWVWNKILKVEIPLSKRASPFYHCLHEAEDFESYNRECVKRPKQASLFSARNLHSHLKTYFSDFILF